MNIVTCVKCVPDGDTVQINADRRIDISEATWQISQYDLNAIEAVNQLKEKYEDIQIVSLTAGGEVVGDSRRRKDILSRGSDKMFCIKEDELQEASADAFYTASVLAAGIKKIGDIDLAIFGEGSGDMYAQQTGLVVGSLLGWPTINAVTRIEIEKNSLLLQRTLEDGSEQLRVALPAVICVTADINTPRFTSVRATLAAGKKPFEIWSLADIDIEPEHGSAMTGVFAPEETGRRRQIYQTPDDNAVGAIVSQLKKFT